MSDEKTVDFASLKRGGAMRQSEPGLFSLRLHVVAGNLDAAQLRTIAEIADKYGRGKVHMTARQGVEIPHVPLASIADVRRALAAGNLELGACGPRVRTVTGCQGSAICPHGLVETTEVCEAIDRHFAGQELPHKLKFGVSGCPNSCLKPHENDVGIMGAVEPVLKRETCDGCMVCTASCETGSMSVGDGHPDFDPATCSNCGDCIASCPNDSLVTGRRGYILFLGGRVGRNPRLGERYGGLIDNVPSLLRVCQALVDLYREKGAKSERFGVMLERLHRPDVEAIIARALAGAQAVGSAA